MTVLGYGLFFQLVLTLFYKQTYAYNNDTIMTQQRERERERGRQTDRQTDTERQRGRDRQTDRQAGRDSDRQQ